MIVSQFLCCNDFNLNDRTVDSESIGEMQKDVRLAGEEVQMGKRKIEKSYFFSFCRQAKNSNVLFNIVSMSRENKMLKTIFEANIRRVALIVTFNKHTFPDSIIKVCVS